MLTEQRYEVILKLLEEKNSITVAEVKDLLNTSESTVRRDITALHNAGKLVKVFGGAVACDRTVITHEPTVEQKAEVNVEAKQLVAAQGGSTDPAGGFYLSGCRYDHSKYAFLSDREKCHLCDQCGSACQDTGSSRIPRISHRRRIKRLHGGCGGEPGADDSAELSFYQRLLRYEPGSASRVD